mmetsp:Transcript_2217/g.6241  ORF Transcript_2217/g.6241 Transcript_2217/m.6241 type:complete len:422 (+) Transcript_2217:95-1360(+)
MVLATLSPDSKPELTIVIAGGGNASHVLLGLLGSNPKYTVRLWNVMDKEVATWKEKLAANDNQVTVFNNAGPTPEVVKGTVERVSVDPKEVVPGADLLLIAVPAFAHEAYLTGAEPFASAKMAVACMVAEGGFDYQLRDIFGERFHSMVTFAMETLPWACRLTEYGVSAEIKGTKDKVHVAITPDSATADVLGFLNQSISVKGRPDFRPSGNYMAPTLMNINAIFHPAVVIGEFEHWDGKTPFKEVPLFYEAVKQEGAGHLIDSISDEYMAIKAAVNKTHPEVDLHTVVSVKDFFFTAYANDISDSSSLARAMNTNKGYQGLKHTMEPAPGGEGLVPSWNARYLTEDIPFGLVPIKGIAQAVGVPTPAIDHIIAWCQVRMGKEYIVDGKLTGKNINETRCPQRYGFYTIDQMVTVEKGSAV